ncbi:exonuclease domain-containing protein [Candidatus Leptofilum sp.]|uniref:exonuclease domain-containing protein n=1 Tax=Candidatus Leptofilum sp. TaxID=3241576 RepID=UPI003B5C6065
MDPQLLQKRPSEIPLVVLDTETTGLYPGLGHRIVEIGAVRLENWQEVGQVSTLLQPGRKMDPKASSVNGIDDDDLVGQPMFSDVADELLALLDGAVVVAHNAEFDAGFLGQELLIHGLKTGGQPAMLPNPWLCTLLLARRHFHFGRNALSHIARHLGVRMGRAHRALSDVYMTAEILKRMVRTLQQRRFETVDDLLHAQGNAIYAPSFSVQMPDVITEALVNGRNLRLLYLGKKGESNRVVTPLYPSQHRGVGYLVAYCHQAKDQRTFRLERIFSAELI